MTRASANPPLPNGRAVRAAVTAIAYDVVRTRAPAGTEVMPLDDGIDLGTIDFLVPRAGDRAIIDVLPTLTELRVLQVMSAGTDWIEPHMPPQAVLCSARGARDAPVAEWVIGALLGATTQLLAAARERTWEPGQLEDLAVSTVLVVGLGSIGRAVAVRLDAFGTRVLGLATHARDDVHGIDELPELLPAADAVVVLTPLTDATRGLIGAAELAAMRDRSLLVNAARGPVVDPSALLAEVATGRLRAVLDVTDPEPLPGDHPLWSAPGVLAITPHLAGDSPRGHALAAAMAAEQFVRWCTGEELHNTVNR